MIKWFGTPWKIEICMPRWAWAIAFAGILPYFINGMMWIWKDVSWLLEKIPH